MDKLKYLYLAVKTKQYHKLAWWIKVFSLTDDNQDTPIEDFDITRINGVYYFNDPAAGKLIEIESERNKPLFSFLDEIIIDPVWVENLNKKVTTKVGNLLVNSLLLADNFNKKIPFIEGPISIRKIEKTIASLLIDNPLENKSVPKDKITINEYLRFIDSRTFLNGISQIAVVAATPKTLLPPPGLKEFRKKLVKEYGDKLKDFKTVAELEKKLSDFDKEWLKDDPSYGKFLSGKVLNVNRKKMYLTYGAEAGFGDIDEAEYIEDSLIDGWTKDPEKIVTMFNSIRAGSYSRGHETQEGGLVAKVVLRATGNFKIKDIDCNSKFGVTMFITKDNVESIVGRYLLKNNGPNELIENIEDAQKYLNKKIILRSLQYCKLDGEEFCKICSGTRLAEHPKGIALAVTEVSAIILISSLKKMHGGVLSVQEFELEDAFS